MADGVNIPAQGTGDTTPKVSTQKVTADTSDVQDVSLTSVVGGVRTRNPTIPVSAASLPLPTGAALDATVTANGVLIGAVNETAPGTDTASSGTNGRLQRLSQRITSLIALLPGSLGQKTMANSLAVTVASDQSAVPVSGTFWQATQPVSGTVTANAGSGTLAVSGPITDAQLRATPVPVSGTVTTSPPANASENVAQINGVTPLMGTGNTGTGSLRVTLATDQVALTNALKVDPSGVTSPVSLANPVLAATATLANVSGSASSVTLQASNAARKGLVVVNDSTAILYVKFGSSASATSFTYFIAGSTNGVPGTLELPVVTYTGIVTGIWASAVGSARVTEMT